MGCAFLFQYQLLSVGDKISFHLLKSSSPLHTTSSAGKELTTIVDVLVVMKASVFIVPALLFMEKPVCAAGKLHYLHLSWVTVKCLCTKSVQLHLPALPCLWEPISIEIKSECERQEIKFMAGGRSTNWKTLNEAFFIHKEQCSGSPCAISPH